MSENMFYIFTSENISFSKYAFYFINNSLYFITLYIINANIFAVKMWIAFAFAKATHIFSAKILKNLVLFDVVV